MNGLYCIHLELTSVCNKACAMCGRRKIDREYPDIRLRYGHMDFDLVEKISKEVPKGIIVQFHNNGDPTCYPRLGEALSLFKSNIRCFNTNGILLVEKASEIIGNVDTVAISVFPNDPLADEQYANVVKFLELKGDRKPNLVYRILGDAPNERYKQLPGIVVSRVLHDPLGSFKYKKPPTIPETGICLEAISHLAIDRLGEVSLCVRFDPYGQNIIGNIKDNTLEEIWNGEKRLSLVQKHVDCKRNEIPFCSKCEYYGVPRGE